MTRYLVNWKTVNNRLPEKADERYRLLMTLLQQTQQSMNTGKTKEFGIDPTGSKGYAVFEGNEVELMEHASKFAPYLELEIQPIFNLDKFTENAKRIAQPILA